MRDALSLELHREVDGTNFNLPRKVKRLRLVANALVQKAIDGDTAAIKEINDRMDGKVPQALIGDDNHEPIRLDVTDDQRVKALEAFLAKTGGKVSQ